MKGKFFSFSFIYLGGPGGETIQKQPGPEVYKNNCTSVMVCMRDGGRSRNFDPHTGRPKVSYSFKCFFFFLSRGKDICQWLEKTLKKKEKLAECLDTKKENSCRISIREKTNLVPRVS